MSASASALPQVLIAGNPNSGKSTLFNALSGANAHVGNYPGVTVDRMTASIQCGSQRVLLVDVPGAYSLTADSPEEQLAIDALFEDETRAVLCVVDATTLQRGLYFALQLIESDVPLVIGLNMMDAAERQGLVIDAEALSEMLGVPVVPIVASKRRGVDELLLALEGQLREAERPTGLRPSYPDAIEADLQALEPTLRTWMPELSAERTRALGLWCLLSLGSDELRGVPELVRQQVSSLRHAAAEKGRNVELEIVSSRYAAIERAVGPLVARRGDAEARASVAERLDDVLTHPVAGLAIFAVVMFVIFEALFAWSEPMIGAIEDLTMLLQLGVTELMPGGPLRDLLVEGVLSGVGNVIVFVPQILILFLLIGFLEDSGYLARVAFVIDRVMKGVGLHGKAFVPLISGFACAVPAVMATRTIERRRDRLLTMLALPLMSCSARLPVFILVVGTVFAGQRVAGLRVGAVALFAMYTLSVLFTLAAAAVMRRTVLTGPAPTFLLELPPYRWPVARVVLLNAWRRLRVFLVDAGTIILAMTIVLWALLSYPRVPELAEQFAAQRAEVMQSSLPAAAQEQALQAIDQQEAAERLSNSYGGRLGKLMEPALEPLGFDWRIGVGIVGAFAAREVFVSTLGVVFGIGETDENHPPLRQELREAKHGDGTPLMTPLSGISLMLFFLLACQCMSTIAVVKRESGSWRWPIFMFTYMTVLAYVVSLLVYQAGKALGFG